MKKAILILMSAAALVATSYAQGNFQNGQQTVEISTSAQCDKCKKAIEEVLMDKKGVRSASVDLESKKVTVTYKSKKINLDDLRKTILAAGFDADSLKASNRSTHKRGTTESH